MSRFLPRRRHLSSTSTASLSELASLLAAGCFHRAVDLAKSLLSSHPPAANVPDLYHALAATADTQDDPRARPHSFLCDAASALVVASARLCQPDGALRLLSLLGSAGDGTCAGAVRSPLPSLSSCNLLLESLLSVGRHADVRAAFGLLVAAGARPDTFASNKVVQACVRPICMIPSGEAEIPSAGSDDAGLTSLGLDEAEDAPPGSALVGRRTSPSNSKGRIVLFRHP